MAHSLELLDKVNDLENEYNGCSVSFDGNEDIEGFYGTIEGFSIDTDGSIYITLVDMDDEAFDVAWDEVKHEEFD